MIDSWHVGVRRVCIKRFSLYVVEFQHFVIIVHWDDCCHAYHIFLFSLEWLHPLEIIRFIKRMVIDIVVGVRVVFDRLVHTNKLVVKVRFVDDLIL